MGSDQVMPLPDESVESVPCLPDDEDGFVVADVHDSLPQEDEFATLPVDDDADLDDHNDPSDSSDDNDEDDDDGDENGADEDAQIEGLHWFKEKEFFCDLLDKFTPAELKEVTFSIHVDGENHQMTVTHLVASHNV